MKYPEKITSTDHQRLLEEYFVKCTGHFDCLMDTKITCCCGKTITSDYYRFTRAAKTPDAISIVFFAGPGCGSKINKTLGSAPPPKFSLYIAEAGGVCSSKESAQKPEQVSHRQPFSALNIEIRNAASFLQMLLSSYQVDALDNLLERTLERPERHPSDKELIFLHRLANNNFKIKRYGCLSKAIAELASSSDKKQVSFEFPLLNKEMKRLGYGDIF